MLLIKNGKLITMAGIYEQTGDILIENGKISRVGNVDPVPADCEVIDAAGRVVTPGLVDAHSGEPPVPRKWTEMKIPVQLFPDSAELTL